MANQKSTTPLLTALVVGACTPVSDPEPVTRGATQVVCRAEAPINSHVSTTSCRPVGVVSTRDGDRDVDDVADSDTPSRTGIFRAVSGYPAASPNAAEGSCGGAIGTD